MKKTLLTLFTLCTVFQFTNAQEQARLSVSPLDSNVTCDKATLIPHTFQNEFLVDSFANKGGKFAYYTFIATAKSGRIKIINPDNMDIRIKLDSTNCGLGQLINFANINPVRDFSKFIIGKKYYIEVQSYATNIFKLQMLGYKKNDNSVDNATTISGIPYSFNIKDYTRGAYSFCKTSKPDSNAVDIFVKFIATSTSATLNLNLNDVSFESRLSCFQLIGSYYSCQAIQSNINLRSDTFTGLTIGQEYSVKISIGGDSKIGYARKNSANNASITLVGGTVTGLENDSQPTFSIAPNPSNGSFTFVSDNNADLVVYDLLGTKVAEFKNVSSNQNIDLQLAKGIYLLNVTTEKGSKVEKLVIE